MVKEVEWWWKGRGASADLRGWPNWVTSPAAMPSSSGWATRWASGSSIGCSATCTPGPGSSARERELIIVAVLTAIGSSDPQVAAHIRALRAIDVPWEEIEETILQTAPYAGIPRAINALKVLRTEQGR